MLERSETTGGRWLRAWGAGCVRAVLGLGLVLLAGCGAGDPPSASGGIDLSAFWAEGS